MILDRRLFQGSDMSEPAEFAAFLTQSATPYNFCDFARSLLLPAGYTEVSEHNFPASLPSQFFVVRDGKTLLAFNIDVPTSALIIGTHNDSPILKLRPNSLLSQDIHFDSYAGPIAHSVHGRDLKLVGAVLVRSPESADGVSLRTVNSSRPICTIPFPSCVSADAELRKSFDRDKEMDAICSLTGRKTLLAYVSELLGVSTDDVVGHDLGMVDARPATVYSDFILSARLDNLASTYASLRAFVGARAKGAVAVCAVFDAEEIGSRTRTGAASEFLGSLLQRICSQFGVDYNNFKARSLFVSADAGHAPHPNFPGRGELCHKVPFGGGVSINDGYNGTFAFDSVGLAMVREAAVRGGAEHKFHCLKNERRGGSTFGPKVEAKLGIRTVDIGHTMQAMHSHREIMAWKDVISEQKLMRTLYEQYEEIRVYIAG
jgi:aspartyl aminopeptidase